jgi:hypothetical protein
MNQLVEAILRFLRNFKLWVVVSPWEQAVRVRLGKQVSVLDAGIHLRLPLADVVYVQSTRLRFTQTDRQTVTAKDGKTVSVVASIGYEIMDLEKLYRTVHHAEDTIRQMVRGSIAVYLSERYSAQVTAGDIARELSAMCDLSAFGLVTSEVIVTDLVIARTYRLIGDFGSYQSGTSLNTERPETHSA